MASRAAPLVQRQIAVPPVSTVPQPSAGRDDPPILTLPQSDPPHGNPKPPLTAAL